MANTTFNGPVRSENGFQVVSKNETTGAFTTSFTLNASGVQVAPVALADDDATLTGAVNGGRVNLVPNGTQDNTYTLPAPAEGLYFSFVYAGGAADATDFILDTGSDTNFFIGGVTFHDTDDGAVSAVFSDGNSNSIVQVNVPAAAQIHVLGLDDTNYQIWGTVVGATAPAFSDQA